MSKKQPARIVELIVRDIHNQNVNAAGARLQISSQHWQETVGPTVEGLARFEPVSPDLYASHLEVWFDGGFASYHVDLPIGNVQIWLCPDGASPVGPQIVKLPPFLPKPPVSVLSRLHVEGRHFVNDTGQRVDLVGSSCFQAYDRFLRGEDLTAVFSQLQELRFNCIRVFGMDYWIPIQLGRSPFKPQDFGSTYYDGLSEFCDLAASYGLYVFFDVFADTGLLMPSLEEQRPHFERVVERLRESSNTLGSLGNELRQHENFVDKTKMPRPAGIAFSSGSEGMDEIPDSPHWDFVCFHPRRDYPSAIKDCCVVDHPLYVQGRAVMLDEPDGFGSPKPNGEPRNTNLEQCALQAGASVESSMGYVFHSQNGIFAQPFDAVTLPFAQEAARVLKGRI